MLAADKRGEIVLLVRLVVAEGPRAACRRRGQMPIMLDRDVALEVQLVGAAGKTRDGDAIAEHIVHPSQFRRLGRDLEAARNQPLVEAVAGAEQHAVFAEANLATIGIAG